MSPLTIRFESGGVHLPRLGLWLDPHEPQRGAEKVFVSHAHADHTRLHREIISSAPTAKLMHARVSGEWVETILPFGEARHFENTGQLYTMTLLPAGHIFGSAMALVEAGGESLLYTGDFKLRAGISAERCEPRPADILVMETTYGRREYRFPPAAEVMEGIIRFCRETLNNDETPVLFGFSLGKSQELLCGLADAGLPLMLHGQVHKLTEIYKEFGHCFPLYKKYESSSARGHVLLCPPAASQSAMLRNFGPVRTAAVTGWAMDPSYRFRVKTDAAFPLSDHADFPELIDLVKRVAPKKVYTLHGFAAEFAQTLRELRYDAQALTQSEQLALPLQSAPDEVMARPENANKSQAPSTSAPVLSPQWKETPTEGKPTVAEGRNSFHGFALACSRIGSTSKKLEKIGILAEYLRRLEPAALAPVNTWFTGHPFPPIQNKVLQLGWALIRDSLCAVGAIDHGAFGQVYLKHSDLGETAFEILLKISPSHATLTIEQIDGLFEQLHTARGPLGKLPLLSRVLRQATALEGKYLIKILTGDLRIGLKEGLVEEAIARAFEVPLEDVKNANLLVGNVGDTAQLAERKALASATLVPLRPVKYMLASPEETAADIWKRVEQWSTASAPERIQSPATSADTASGQPGIPTVWIEDKYDGIRCQLHKVGERVELYSRDLKEITATFLDLVDLVRSSPLDFIIDGEILAMRGGMALPFAELQKRLGRRERDLFLSDEIPVQFIAFDLLWFNGESYLEQPLSARRAELEKLPGIRLSQITRADSAAAIDDAFSAARQRGNEGLVIKDPNSVYTPGRRGLAWLKLKKAHGTLDCIVVGAEYGHGKRKAVLSDYTFAVRDDATGQLKTIGKAYSGLTDVEIAELTKHFLSKAVGQRGRYFEVEPDTVLEIAFDAVQESARHSSGLALRFPRILRIRRDKSAAEIDTVSTAQKFVKA